MLSMDALNTEKCCFDESIDNIRRGSAAGQRRAKRRRHAVEHRVACLLQLECVLASVVMRLVGRIFARARMPSGWLAVGERVVQLVPYGVLCVLGARPGLLNSRSVLRVCVQNTLLSHSYANSPIFFASLQVLDLILESLHCIPKYTGCARKVYTL